MSLEGTKPGRYLVPKNISSVRYQPVTQEMFSECYEFKVGSKLWDESLYV